MVKNNCEKKGHEATETMELACEDGVDGKESPNQGVRLAPY
jgi:hypothetical protein